MQKISRKIRSVWMETRNKVITFYLMTTGKVHKRDPAVFLEIYKENRNIFTQSTFPQQEGAVMPAWQKYVKDIEGYFLNDLSFDFLNTEVIGGSMFFNPEKKWGSIQRSFLKNNISADKLKGWLREYNVGHPVMNDLEFATSGNNINMLFHIAKFSKEGSLPLEKVQSVMEFGGGFGAMAKIFKTLNPQATYFIIDLPIFSFIQATYLQTIFGKDSVALLLRETDLPQTGKINIIPFNKRVIEKIAATIKPDLFLSTWALSETPLVMQEYIRSLNYFNAKYLLLAYQKNNADFPEAEKIGLTSDRYEVFHNKETEFLKNNYYLFAKAR